MTDIQETLAAQARRIDALEREVRRLGQYRPHVPPAPRLVQPERPAVRVNPFTAALQQVHREIRQEEDRDEVAFRDWLLGGTTR